MPLTMGVAEMAAMDVPAGARTSVRRAVLNRRTRFLVAATISYNVIEDVVAINAGNLASSSALIGSDWTLWSRSLPPWPGSLVPVIRRPGKRLR